MTTNLKTVLHTYRFDIRKPDEKAAWEALKAKLSTGPHCMESWGGASHYDFVSNLDGREIELETKCLFDNQWNTAPINGHTDKGLRVFDWALDASGGGLPLPSWRKQGHYLEQTDAMREIRRNTLKCPYCGYQEAAQKGSVFCPACLDSEYLSESDVRKGATRLTPVEDRRLDWTPLTVAEADHLMPLYRDAQLHGSTERGKARLAKTKADIESKAAKAIKNATTERDGMLWLWERMPGILQNTIYYDHTGRFGFGWRKPLGESEVSALLDVISEFPYPYDIKTAQDSTHQGRTLSGGIAA